MRGLRWALLLLLAAPPVAAQRIVLTGTVFDSTTARPLGGALVSLSGARPTRTDEGGGFMLVATRAGETAVEVRRIGYAPRRVSIQIPAGVEHMDVPIGLQRVAALDTVRVFGATRALYGLVGASKDLRPLADADVELLGAGLRTRSDAQGRFFIEVKTGRNYLVRAKRDGFAPEMMSVSVPDSGGLEISLLLDSGIVYPRRLHMALAAFDERVKWRSPLSSSLVPHVELLRDPDAELVDAVRYAPSFQSKAIRFGRLVCLYVEGMPRPGVPLTSYDLARLEFVETYAAGGDYTKQIGESWPKGAPCSPTGVARPATSRDEAVVQYMVIWLRR